MCMSDPMPETRTSIVLLSLSSTKPRGTLKTPPRSIQVDSGTETDGCVKIKQLQTKLPSTAAIETKLLRALNRSVNKVMAAAETSGSSNAYHRSMLFMSI